MKNYLPSGTGPRSSRHPALRLNLGTRICPLLKLKCWPQGFDKVVPPFEAVPKFHGGQNVENKSCLFPEVSPALKVPGSTSIEPRPNFQLATTWCGQQKEPVACFKEPDSLNPVWDCHLQLHLGRCFFGMPVLLCLSLVLVFLFDYLFV